MHKCNYLLRGEQYFWNQSLLTKNAIYTKIQVCVCSKRITNKKILLENIRPQHPELSELSVLFESKRSRRIRRK